MIGVLLKYSDFFTDNPPKDKFELVKHIPRCELIATFSSLNFQIKKPLDLNFNFTLENQIKIIGSIYHLHEDPRGIKFCKPFFSKLKNHYIELNGGAAICTRTSCLYTINEILFCTQLKYEEKPGIKFYPDDYLAVFKFMLLCNAELLSYNEPYKTEITTEKLKDKFFEAFMFKEIPSNQYGYIQNPVNLLERSRQLFEFLKAKYSKELKSFTSDYQIESPEHFISILANHFFFNAAGIEFIHAFKVSKSNKDVIHRLDALSARGAGKPNSGVKKFEFLEIKKSPVYRVEGKKENIYILMDNTFLIEKCYELFFWDFYFDELKKHGKRIEEWGGEVGIFFEHYAKNILKYCFDDHLDIFMRSTDELIVNGNEYVDFYIRRKRNIILIQAKRSFVPQISFKEVYSLRDFEELNKDEFYSRFGLNQIVEMSLNRFDEYSSKIDKKLPNNKLFIYPVILINEPIISFAVTSFMFNKKFEELLDKHNLERENKNWRISRLTILHINELEKLQESLKRKKIKLDYLLQGYSDSTNVELTKDNYSAFQTLDNYIKKKIRSSAIPDYIKEANQGIIKEIIEFGKLNQ